MDESVLKIYGGGDRSCQSISEVIERKCEVLSKIYLRQNEIGDENAEKSLYPALVKVSNLLELDLSGNKLSDISSYHKKGGLAWALHDKVTVRILSLESNRLSGISTLSSSLS